MLDKSHVDEVPQAWTSDVATETFTHQTREQARQADLSDCLQ